MSGSDDFDDWYDKALQGGQGFKTPEERQTYLDSLGDPLKHPMFAQNSEDLEGNPLVEAIRALKEDDKTPLELAIMYKDEGNEWMKRNNVKNQKEAFVRYTVALDHIKKSQQVDKECQNLPQLKSQIFSNRALASLNLKNFGQCVKDSNEAIQSWSRNAKAHYRKCKALSCLKRHEEVMRAGEEALLAIPAQGQSLTAESSHDDSKWVVAIKKLMEESDQTLTLRRRAKETADLQLRTRWLEAYDLCRRASIRPSAWTEAAGDLGAHSSLLTDPWELLPRRHPETLSTEWTVVFLYPEHGQLDVVKACALEDMLAVHLVEALPEEGEGEPLVWDTRHDYHASTVTLLLALHPPSPSTAWRRLCTNKTDWLAACTTRLRRLKGEISEETSADTSTAAAAELPPRWLEVHPGCSIGDILRVEGCDLAGAVLSLVVHVRGHAAHDLFMSTVLAEGRFCGLLQPNGIITAHLS